MPKFFVRREAIDGNIITLSGDDAYHISRSLRMTKGEHISVSDMQGTEYDCELEAFLPDSVRAVILSSRQSDNEPPKKIHLFQALPKGDKIDTVIQKTVECGVHDIHLFESERCVAKSKGDSEARKTERRNRIALEAAKQCGRGHIPTVYETTDFQTAVEQALMADLFLFCYEGERETSLKQALTSCGENLSSIAVMIGSEGGFSTSEAAYAVEKGAVPISLGKRILRTETAAAFVLGCLVYEYEM